VYREVRYGRVDCTVRLPGPIDPDSVSARYRDGVLEISMKAPTGTKPTGVSVIAA
jgi:HSP20 family molecular chaperone IbpA